MGSLTVDAAWGFVVAAIGGLFMFWGRIQSTAGIYRLLAARARILWGDRVHAFFQFTGLLMIVLGVALALLRI